MTMVPGTSVNYYKNLFTLPLHTLLTNEDVETVCNAMREVFKRA